MAESDTKRGSDDSGNDSTCPVDMQFVTVTHQQKTASVERILSCSTNSMRTDARLYMNMTSSQDSANNKENYLKKRFGHSPSPNRRFLPRSNPGSPRFQHRIGRAKLEPTDRAGSLPRNSKFASPHSVSRRIRGIAAKKPVPQPRKKDYEPVEMDSPPTFEPIEMDSAARAFLIGDDILRYFN